MLRIRRTTGATVRLVSPSPRIAILCLALAACASRENHVEPIRGARTESRPDPTDVDRMDASAPVETSEPAAQDETPSPIATSDAGRPNVDPKDCFSPKRTKTIFADAAVGCSCRTGKDRSVCVHTKAHGAIALVCEGGHWHTYFDGPCEPD